MIPLVCAVAIWLHLITPAPFNYLLDATALAFVLWQRRQGAWLVLVSVCLAAVSLVVHTHSEVRDLAAGFQTREISAEVIGVNRVRLDEISGCEACAGAIGGFYSEAQLGAKVHGLALIRPARGFGEFVIKGRLEITPHLSTPIATMRERFLSALAGVEPRSEALVAGLAIGDTSRFSEEFSNNLKTLSLTHLSAVSGANCAIVIGLLYFILGRTRLGRSGRVVIAVCALFGYVILVGGSASVIRAAVMATIVLVLASRGVWPLAALSLASSLMLIYDPSYALDYGFALSVSATGGILVLTPSLSVLFERRLPKWLSLSLAATVAAQLWCMPVLLGLQAGIPTYSVLANLLVEPVVAPITVLGILACVVSPIAPFGATALSYLASVAAQWIVLVSDRLVQLPATVLAWHTGILGMILLVASLSAAIYRRKFALVAVAVLFVEIVINGVGLVHRVTWLPSDWRLVNCDVGQGDALVIRGSGGIAVVDVGREPDLIDNCLSELGVKQIDLLMLTHFDQDHVGGLSGALHNRRVINGMVTTFRDERPNAAYISAMLQEASERVIKGSIGSHGSLGDVSWEVLAPSATASEAEDSNDGSIVARWNMPGMVLYTMADLGEKGQMRLPRLGAPAGVPIVLKVSHHGSADQFPELIEAMNPDLALISVGKANGYGHPTKRTLDLLSSIGAKVLRTDQLGAIAVTSKESDLTLGFASGG